MWSQALPSRAAAVGLWPHLEKRLEEKQMLNEQNDCVSVGVGVSEGEG